MVWCEDAPVRALLLVAAACAALVAVSPATAGGRVVERGVVQSVGPAELVLRALDGTETTVQVGPETRIRLNGRPAPLSSIREGFVAEAVVVGDGPARGIRAFGRAAPPTLVGQIVVVRPHALVILRPSGRRIRVPLTARTTVLQAGNRVARHTLSAGMRVRIARTPSGATRVVIVRPGA